MSSNTQNNTNLHPGTQKTRSKEIDYLITLLNNYIEEQTTQSGMPDGKTRGAEMRKRGHVIENYEKNIPYEMISLTTHPNDGYSQERKVKGKNRKAYVRAYFPSDKENNIKQSLHEKSLYKKRKHKRSENRTKNNDLTYKVNDLEKLSILNYMKKGQIEVGNLINKDTPNLAGQKDNFEPNPRYSLNMKNYEHTENILDELNTDNEHQKVSADYTTTMLPDEIINQYNILNKGQNDITEHSDQIMFNEKAKHENTNFNDNLSIVTNKNKKHTRRVFDILKTRYKDSERNKDNANEILGEKITTRSPSDHHIIATSIKSSGYNRNEKQDRSKQIQEMDIFDEIAKTVDHPMEEASGGRVQTRNTNNKAPKITRYYQPYEILGTDFKHVSPERIKSRQNKMQYYIEKILSIEEKEDKNKRGVIDDLLKNDNNLELVNQGKQDSIFSNFPSEDNDKCSWYNDLTTDLLINNNVNKPKNNDIYKHLVGIRNFDRTLGKLLNFSSLNVLNQDNNFNKTRNENNSNITQSNDQTNNELDESKNEFMEDLIKYLDNEEKFLKLYEEESNNISKTPAYANINSDTDIGERLKTLDQNIFDVKNRHEMKPGNGYNDTYNPYNSFMFKNTKDRYQYPNKTKPEPNTKIESNFTMTTKARIDDTFIPVYTPPLRKQNYKNEQQSDIDNTMNLNNGKDRIPNEINHSVKSNIRTTIKPTVEIAKEQPIYYPRFFGQKKSYFMLDQPYEVIQQPKEKEKSVTKTSTKNIIIEKPVTNLPLDMMTPTTLMKLTGTETQQSNQNYPPKNGINKITPENKPTVSTYTPSLVFYQFKPSQLPAKARNNDLDKVQTDKNYTIKMEPPKFTLRPINNKINGVAKNSELINQPLSSSTATVNSHLHGFIKHNSNSLQKITLSLSSMKTTTTTALVEIHTKISMTTMYVTTKKPIQIFNHRETTKKFVKTSQNNSRIKGRARLRLFNNLLSTTKENYLSTGGLNTIDTLPCTGNVSSKVQESNWTSITQYTHPTEAGLPSTKENNTLHGNFEAIPQNYTSTKEIKVGDNKTTSTIQENYMENIRFKRTIGKARRKRYYTDYKQTRNGLLRNKIQHGKYTIETNTESLLMTQRTRTIMEAKQFRNNLVSVLNYILMQRGSYFTPDLHQALWKIKTALKLRLVPSIDLFLAQTNLTLGDIQKVFAHIFSSIAQFTHNDLKLSAAYLYESLDNHTIDMTKLLEDRAMYAFTLYNAVNRSNDFNVDCYRKAVDTIEHKRLLGKSFR